MDYVEDLEELGSIFKDVIPTVWGRHDGALQLSTIAVEQSQCD